MLQKSGQSNFDPSKPLFNKAAFEPVDAFSFYLGRGPRISNVRGFGYHNHDFSLIKNIKVRERVNFQARFEFFNVWNWHIFNTAGSFGSSAFDTDIASPSFGMWNGEVSDPRNIQIGARLTF